LKFSANVKIAVQCFENFGGEMPQMPPPWLRAFSVLLAAGRGVQRSGEW